MKIYVVDDDPMERMIVLERLSDQDYEIREFDNATAFLAALEDPPDLILLDIEMPGMNGVDACRAMRAMGHTQETVVFVSAHDDMATRMAAYDAGGDDYIVKPYFAEELARKVKLAESSLQARKNMALQAQFAQQTAFTAMSSMGELGLVLEFLRQSFDSGGVEQLAERVFGTLRQFGLEGLARVETDHQPRYFSSKGPCSQIEASILDHATKMDRLFQFRDRIAINYPHITIMALNLPMDDADRVGRMRDHLAILIEGASARVEALDSERRRNAQSTGIAEILATLTQRLEGIDQAQARTRVRVAEINDRYMQDLMHAFVHLGLSEDQERLMTDMAQQSQALLTMALDDDRGQSDALRQVAARLREIAAI